MDADSIARALRQKYETPQAVIKALGLSPTLLAKDSAMPMRRRAFDQEELNSFSESELEDLLQAVQQTMGDRATLRRSRDRLNPDDGDWARDARKRTYDRFHKEADDRFAKAFPRGRDDLAVGPQEASGGQGISPRDQTGESPWQGQDSRRYAMDQRTSDFYTRVPDARRIKFW